jgi:hypothetical protein
VLAEIPPLAMVGGHDHSLQIIEGGDEARSDRRERCVVEVTAVTAIEGTLFAHAHRGFVVFDFHAAKKNDRRRAGRERRRDGRGDKPVFSLALDLEREERRPNAFRRSCRTP